MERHVAFDECWCCLLVDLLLGGSLLEKVKAVAEAVHNICCAGHDEISRIRLGQKSPSMDESLHMDIICHV